MKKLILLVVFLIFTYHMLKMLKKRISITSSFISYLIDEDSYDESLKCILLAKKEGSINYDSLQLFEATVYLKMKKLDSATKFFDKISPNSNLFLLVNLMLYFVKPT